MSAKAILSASVSAPAVYVEDVFSTFLYTGNSSTQTITNGIDLSGKGGLTWIKQRDTSGNHLLMTTAGGPTNRLRSNGTPSYSTSTAGSDFSSFNSNGFSLGVNQQSDINTAAQTYVSWSLRKQPKFFDVVTWTGNGVAGRTVAHNLGSVPGCIIIGATTALGTDWAVYHRSLANTEYLTLNSTAAKATSATYWNSTTPTASVFSLGTDATVNYNTGTYIAYVFAHDAGGFGTAGTDNVISCGSFTSDASSKYSVTLGYEPQWLMVKRTNGVGPWYLMDTMRNFKAPLPADSYNSNLEANTSIAEDPTGFYGGPTATGFADLNGGTGANNTFIYIAIRRGPMKVPTLGTSVYNAIARTGTGTATTVSNSGFTPDTVLSAPRTAGPSYGLAFFFDRLRGPTYLLETRSTQATQTGATTLTGFDTMNGYIVGVDASGYGAINANAVTYINWNFRRAPGFFDVVCYTGTSSTRTVSHNLAAVPQLMITKVRSSAGYGWFVYPLDPTKYMELNETSGTGVTSSAWNNTAPTASVFTVGPADQTNLSGATMVAYLFATCAGVSKVGSYTGNGTTQTINCGFTSGARFVLIKRTDSTGSWYVWDTARGIVSADDPYLLLNSTAAEVTNTDYIDPLASGFEISSTAPAEINANGGSYIFLAVA